MFFTYPSHVTHHFYVLRRGQLLPDVDAVHECGHNAEGRLRVFFPATRDEHVLEYEVHGKDVHVLQQPADTDTAEEGGVAIAQFGVRPERNDCLVKAVCHPARSELFLRLGNQVYEPFSLSLVQFGVV